MKFQRLIHSGPRLLLWECLMWYFHQDENLNIILWTYPGLTGWSRCIRDGNAHTCITFYVCKVDKPYYSKSSRLMRKETESNVTDDISIASKNHSPLHKFQFAALLIEKVLENTRHVKLRRTCPQQSAPHPPCDQWLNSSKDLGFSTISYLNEYNTKMK